jgi:hypothetical protein
MHGDPCTIGVILPLNEQLGRDGKARKFTA